MTMPWSAIRSLGSHSKQLHTVKGWSTEAHDDTSEIASHYTSMGRVILRQGKTPYEETQSNARTNGTQLPKEPTDRHTDSIASEHHS